LPIPATIQLFSQLTELLTPKLVDFGALLFGERLEWIVKEMWTNVLEAGGHQVMHAHANSFVSGVLYLTDSDPRCRTVFVRPPGGFDYRLSASHPQRANGTV
jgi:hypothetical protein